MKTYRTLTPALQALLDASMALGTTNNKVLAGHLCVSQETVKSGFRRIGLALGTHSRSETLLRALQNGWVLPPTPRPESESRHPALGR